MPSSPRSLDNHSDIRRPSLPFFQSHPLIPVLKPPSTSTYFSKSSLSPFSLSLSLSLRPTISNSNAKSICYAAARMAAALQQTPITFRSSSPPSAQTQSKPTTKLSLSSSLKLPRFTIKPLRRRAGRGASGARMADTAAGSYAKALSDVAKSNKTLQVTAADLDKLVGKVFSDDAVLGYFTNPTVPEEEKFKFVDEISKSLCLQPHVANFLNILVDMKRIDLIKEIAKEFELIYNQLTDTQVATVTSVVQLETQHLAEIAKRVQKLTGAKNVNIKTAIDESLVAGFTIRYGDSGSKLIDLSVKKQLEEIAQQLEIGDIQLAV